MESLLQNAAQRAENYLEEIKTRRVGPSEGAIQALEKFDQDLPQGGWGAEKVLRLLPRSTSLK